MVNKNMNRYRKIVLGAALFVTMPVMAIEQGDILVNARVINISPDTSNNQVMASGSPLAAPAGENQEN